MSATKAPPRFATWGSGVVWRVAAIRHFPISYAELETPSGGRTPAPLNRITILESDPFGKWLTQPIAEATS